MIDEPEIFKVAAALPADERPAYFDAACAGEPEVRARVEELLRSHDVSGFMEAQAAECVRPEMEAELARLKPEEIGDQIGPYKLMEQIGQGGFGTVWVADQEKPVRRRVALKIIKLGMDTKEVIARFEQERQALAMMDHPHIAKVFDAGATQWGRPFFVMELVRGIKITDYCDQANLPTAERLALFIQVCQAVQHAHQKGIIHRDLKPSNILVTLHDGVPVPKVIDFGVAKATQQTRLTDLTIYTQLQQMIGTPLYMSPEQAEMSGLDIDTRSDIYSLGVLLYELLTGRTPFDPEELMKAGLDEIRRVIREQEPQTPSLFLKTMADANRATVAQHRQSDPAKLTNLLRGDLDWIVMKALEKDRSRRYETANGLARDIHRHLQNEPVAAGPPSRIYRLQKLMRRNKLAFAAGSAVVAAVLLGLTVSIWQAARANAALADLRATAPAFAAQARGLAGNERFAEAIEKLEYAIKLRPDAAEYLLAKADLLQCQFRFAEAAPIYRAALRLNPNDARAQTNAALCDQLRAEQAAQPKLSRETLVQFLATMAREHRSAAEMLPAGRLVGEEKKLVLAMWLERLEDLPIPPKKPLEERLTMGDDGMLKLDLSGTPVVDLSALEGMPLGWLSLANCDSISALDPIAGLPVKTLELQGTNVSDLGPLAKMSALVDLNLAKSKVQDLASLRGLRLKNLDLSDTKVADIAPLTGMPLEDLSLDNTYVSELGPLAGMTRLRSFGGSKIPVRDFSPLADKPIEVLNLQWTRVADLSFLRGIPLKQLMLTGCGAARGFGVLSEIKTLELLVLPNVAVNSPDAETAAIDALRKHPALRQIGNDDDFSGFFDFNATQAKEEFWNKWDDMRYQRLLRDVLKLEDRGKLIEVAKEMRSGLKRIDATTKPPLSAGRVMTRLQLCALLVYLGDHATYRAVCAELVVTSKGTADRNAAERAAKAFLLLPDSGVDVAIVTPLVHLTQEGRDKGDLEPWTLLLSLIANYRAGDFAAAVDAGSRLMEHPKAAPETKAAGNAVLAMVAQRSDRHASATAALNAARELMVDHWQARAYYWDWMMASVLLREAEQLVEGGSPNAK